MNILYLSYTFLILTSTNSILGNFHFIVKGKPISLLKTHLIQTCGFSTPFKPPNSLRTPTKASYNWTQFCTDYLESVSIPRATGLVSQEYFPFQNQYIESCNYVSLFFHSRLCSNLPWFVFLKISLVKTRCVASVVFYCQWNPTPEHRVQGLSQTDSTFSIFYPFMNGSETVSKPNTWPYSCFPFPWDRITKLKNTTKAYSNCKTSLCFVKPPPQHSPLTLFYSTFLLQ